MRRSDWTRGLAIVALSLFAILPSVANGGPSLVSADLIARQKALTATRKLSNGIPVIIRSVPGSAVFQVNVVFAQGYRDVPVGRKASLRWTMGTMTRGATGYTRDQVYALTAKYGLGLTCFELVEASMCSLSTVSEHVREGLPLLGAVVNAPTLADEDLKIVRDRVLAEMRSTPTDPSGYVNELVNGVFYPAGHPYFSPYRDEIAGLEKASFADARARHRALLNASRMFIVVVGSLPEKEIIDSLETLFGKVPSSSAKIVPVSPPRYNPARAVAFEARDVPNGYVHLKFNIPGSRHKDATGTELMLAVLSEKLFEELRTKRSLSYSAYAYPRLYEVGIGVMGSSTSNIRATMEGMAQIVAQLRDREMTPEELTEYKMGYVTEYYLTQESHVALGAALSLSWLTFGSVDPLYEAPSRIEAVTPADVRRLAREYLRDVRGGVIASKDKFDAAWFSAFLRSEFAPAQ